MLTLPNADEVVDKQEFSLLMEMQKGIVTLEHIWHILTKPNTLLPHDAVISLLGI